MATEKFERWKEIPNSLYLQSLAGADLVFADPKQKFECRFCGCVYPRARLKMECQGWHVKADKARNKK